MPLGRRAYLVIPIYKNKKYREMFRDTLKKFNKNKQEKSAARINRTFALLWMYWLTGL